MYHENDPAKKESRRKRQKKNFIDLDSSDFTVEAAEGLRWYFTKCVFYILVGSSLFVTLCAFLLEKIGLFSRLSFSLSFLILCMFGASLLIGALITVLISKNFLRPINTLSSAMKRVAGGDFTVKLNEDVSIAFVHQLNSDFNHMVHELNTVGTLRNDFVSNVSHEFKTPLAAIEGYAVLLQDESLSIEDRREYTERILFSSRRLSTLVANILAISKLDNETMPLPHSVYRIDEQIRRNILSLEPKWSAKNIEFELNMENIEFNAVESLMNHVFVNLIDNAIKFSPDGGMIYVSLAINDDTLNFTIANSGPAISDETMKHLFEKFYQGDTSHRSEGNGLGLALVKKIILLHDGSISARNTPDGLVEFDISMPVGNDAANNPNKRSGFIQAN